MPVVRLYLAELEFHSPHRPDRPVATFVEWSFALPTAGEWAEDGAMRVVRTPALEVFVRSPPLSRLVDRVSPLTPRPWSFPDRALATHWDSTGLLASMVAGLARRKDRGFSFVTKEEALAAQPSLFADLDAPPEPAMNGPYKRPKRPVDAVVPQLQPTAVEARELTLTTPGEIEAAQVLSGALAGVAENRRRREPIPWITPENLEDTMRELLKEDVLLRNDLLRFCVLAMATAVARCRESDSGSVLAAIGLELAIGDVLGRRVTGTGNRGAS